MDEIIFMVLKVCLLHTFSMIWWGKQNNPRQYECFNRSCLCPNFWLQSRI